MGVDSSVGNERIENNEIGVDGNWTENEIEVDAIGNDINNSEIDSDISVELAGENETATPENQQATEHIADAREKLISAYDTYTSQSTGRRPRMTGINPTVDSFQWTGIRRDVQDAMDALEAGAEYAEGGQAVNVLALEQVGYLIMLSARADSKLIDAYDHFEFATERLFNGSTAQAEQARFRMNDDWEEAEERFRELDEHIEPQSAQAFSQMSERHYERKVRQLDSAIASFQEFQDGLESIQNGLSNLEPGVDAYLADEWEDARDRFTRASAEFGVASTSFTLVPQVTGMSSVASDMHATVSTMEQAANDLQRSAQGRVDDDRLIYFEARRAAEEHINSDERVKNISAFNDIVY